jgi:hypothetical protein
MYAFVGEGRLVRGSLIAREGSNDFHSAGGEPDLVGSFNRPFPKRQSNLRLRAKAPRPARPLSGGTIKTHRIIIA